MIQERMFKNKHEGKKRHKGDMPYRKDWLSLLLLSIFNIRENNHFKFNFYDRKPLQVFSIIFTLWIFNRMSDLNIRGQIMFAEFLERHGRDRSKVNDVVTS